LEVAKASCGHWKQKNRMWKVIHMKKCLPKEGRIIIEIKGESDNDIAKVKRAIMFTVDSLTRRFQHDRSVGIKIKVDNDDDGDDNEPELRETHP